MSNETDCILCLGAAGDADLRRVQVWEDDLWRSTVSVESEVPGFAYLEPKRHIPHITDLDGEEAATLGTVLGRITRALKEVTGAELVYVYVFGSGIPHLHVHMAPHSEGDALNPQIIKGDIVMERLPSGAFRLISKDYPPLPEEGLREVADLIRERLAVTGDGHRPSRRPRPRGLPSGRPGPERLR
jgi:diadenosine tetraphosphate (Ap4A) HIT family hydrolase